MLRRMAQAGPLEGKQRLIVALASMIAPEARVCASHNLVPILANRTVIYEFPNPWRAYYWGIQGEGLPDPSTVDVLFLDTHAIGPELSAEARARVAAERLQVLFDAHGLLLAHRVRPAGPSARP
jgi:hypothetical protein